MARKVDVYTIENDVPLPEEQTGSVPIDSLKVGESILFPLEKRELVSGYASHLKKRKGKVFTVRTIDKNNARVWRKE